MYAFLISVVLLAVTPVWGEDSIGPLTTDYCTNYREGTRENPELWKHCCLIHDMHFWAGGNKQDRYESDLSLKQCITDAGAPKIARIMYLAVRLGSYSPIKYPKKKWNHGWKNRPEFQSLNNHDINSIESELTKGYDFISYEIKESFIEQLRSRLD